MKVSQILNNNVAVVKRGNNEVIVYSKGIAFRKKAGDRIDDADIQKTYVLDSHDKLEHFSYLLSKVDEEYLEIVNKTIAYAEEIIGNKTSDYLYLALLDHISYVIERLENGQELKNPLGWEVKRFYPDYYKIGKYCVSLINSATGLYCSDEEAITIALHFVNLQGQINSTSDTIVVVETIKNILAIIKYHFKMDFEEDSINYMRLVTHLQYFIVRLMKDEVFDSPESELNRQIRKMYPEAYKCVNKIRVYVQDSFKKYITSDEEAYLILHIQRVTQREEK